MNASRKGCTITKAQQKAGQQDQIAYYKYHIFRHRESSEDVCTQFSQQLKRATA
ncbi:hypothetical protein [Mariprofundus erugo]|uniref:hypothetical protein n=1 Tax=Mariprofundus erugo TaxID=2528639 RepID=UPI001386F00A|nr:hypothetical protein [Mariprofundus erugo]